MDTNILKLYISSGPVRTAMTMGVVAAMGGYGSNTWESTGN